MSAHISVCIPDDLTEAICQVRENTSPPLPYPTLTEALDTTTPTGRTMWQLIGVLAELERSLISERTRAGVKAAQSRGVKFGRKPKLTAAQLTHARQQIDQGSTVQDVAAGRVTEFNADKIIERGGSYWPDAPIPPKKLLQ